MLILPNKYCEDNFEMLQFYCKCMVIFDKGKSNFLKYEVHKLVIVLLADMIWYKKLTVIKKSI